MPHKKPKLKILNTGDKYSAFPKLTAREVLNKFGPPKYLLGSSKKLDKCTSVQVLARVLYLTPGIFCPSATKGCLRACLGHSSGFLAMPTHAAARDKRAALYLEQPDHFHARLTAELHLLEADANQLGFQPAVRLNGSSDIAWEIMHPELFQRFPNIQFYDYTKVFGRMRKFLENRFPTNYHLTFSADCTSLSEAQTFLDSGGNVAALFWPALPRTWWQRPVIDGDRHDARFQDATPSVIGLRAKGPARIDTSGFTFRPCPICSCDADELQLRQISGERRRSTVHICNSCGYKSASRWTIAA